MTAAVAALRTALADRYRIERELGAGGMATVYLAHDLKHERDVAIKVLHQDLAAALGAERFLAEIKTTAKLQHPHILPLLDSGEAAGLLYYVMPYVAGESLRDRLNREKQLPIEDAVRIAREVADALGHAHGHGIIHRDIKPENILLQEGHALVADFGIALAVQSAGGQRMTQTGLSLGTPQYMSPEQAMGEKAIDLRADIYALGAVTYEMLTGEPPFTGATVQAIVAKVMSDRPTPPSMVRDTVPAHVEATVLRALAKLPADRFATAMDLALALNATSMSTVAGVSGLRLGQRGAEWMRDRRTQALVAVALVLAAVVAWPRLFRGGDGTEALRVSIAAPPGTRFDAVNWSQPAMAPDGRSVAFVARGANGSRVYVRRLDSFDARALPGTDDAFQAVSFSPDGKRLAFKTSRYDVRVVAVSGDVAAISLGTYTDWFGQPAPIWLDDSTVISASVKSALKYSLNGGGAQPFATVDEAAGEQGFSAGVTLPGRRLLVSVVTDSMSRATTKSLVYLSDGTRREMKGLRGHVNAFVAPDLVISEVQGQFFAVRVDLDRYETTGEPYPVLGGASSTFISSSRDGDVAYFQVPRSQGRRLVWVDEHGVSTPIAVEPGEYRSPRLSADGRRAVLYGNAGTTQLATTVIDLASGGRIKLPGLEWTANPIWDGSGKSVLVAAGLQRPQRIVRQAADGTGAAPAVFHTPGRSAPYSMSPDGSVLVEELRETCDITLAKSDGTSRPVVEGPGTQRIPMLSPDGRWLAYQGTENDRFEIFVQPWPALDRKWAVSTDGGTEPVWSRDSKTLYFRHGNSIMRSRISASPSFAASRPELLFDATHFSADPGGDPSFDVAPDGRFLMIEEDPVTRADLRVELRALARGKRASIAVRPAR